MSVFFCFFVIIGAALIPFAYIIGILDKIATMDHQPTFKAKLLNNLIFIPFGLIILTCNYCVDLYYFWRNSFRLKSELKKIIIQKEESKVSHKSIRQIMKIGEKYSKYKIKTTLSSALIKRFSSYFEVSKNIQFLVFGQMIPQNGFESEENQNTSRGYTFKTMKT